MTEEFDEPDAEFPAPGVPPPPSVTPGSAPPPPGASAEPVAPESGCLTLLVIAGIVAVLGVVLLALLVVVGVKFFGSDDPAADEKALQDVFIETGIASASTDAVHPPQRDLKLGACEGDGNGGVRAAGTITNWTGSPADYRIDVSFRSMVAGSVGEEFAARVVAVRDVPEHTTADWSAMVEDPPEGAFACRVVAVNRWKAGTGPLS